MTGRPVDDSLKKEKVNDRKWTLNLSWPAVALEENCIMEIVALEGAVEIAERNDQWDSSGAVEGLLESISP